MRIVADENIPLVNEFFGEFGEIVALPGRNLRPEQLRDADVLLVRSVTRVDADLLAGSRVRFVGTATIGCDHVDQAYLQQQGISFANAPGCNATSVVEYVLSTLAVMNEQLGRRWGESKVGIIGLGNVGGRLKRTLEALGYEVLACDPPLRDQGVHGLVDLEMVLTCPTISIHTPLSRSGDHPTHHLLNKERLERLQSDQVLINTARGPVIEEAALLEKLRQHPEWPVVLDVWEFEPRVNQELLSRVRLGSAHIAGYSLDGKMRGTEMIYQALCAHLKVPARTSLDELLPAPPLTHLRFGAPADVDEALNIAIRACYDVRTDDALLRRALTVPSEQQAAAFDQLRKQYRVRREFARTQIAIDAAERQLRQYLGASGFRLDEI